MNYIKKLDDKLINQIVGCIQDKKGYDITILNDKILEEIPEISFTSIENGIKRFVNEN